MNAEPPNSKPRWYARKVPNGCAWTLLLSLLVSLFIPTGSSHLNEKSGTTKAISNARQLITAIRIFASDNAGAFPDELDELVAAGVIGEETLMRLLRSPYSAKDKPFHWIYWPGLSDGSSAGHSLLISPVLHDQRNILARWWNRDGVQGLPSRPKRIVGTVDSTVTLMDEKDFQDMLNRQRLVLPVPEPHL